MKRTILTGSVAVLTLLCISATDRRPVPTGTLARLLDDKLESRTRAFQEVKSQRDWEIAQLLAIARQKQKLDEAYGARHLAIELLGEYRADEQEVVQFLLDNITLHYNVVVSERSPLTGYACATALSKIGQLTTRARQDRQGTGIVRPRHSPGRWRRDDHQIPNRKPPQRSGWSAKTESGKNARIHFKGLTGEKGTDARRGTGDVIDHRSEEPRRGTQTKKGNQEGGNQEGGQETLLIELGQDAEKIPGIVSADHHQYRRRRPPAAKKCRIASKTPTRP